VLPAVLSQSANSLRVLVAWRIEQNSLVLLISEAPIHNQIQAGIISE
jgi:hypothetical protein